MLNGSWRISDDRSISESTELVNRYNTRLGAGFTSSSDNPNSRNNNKFSVQKRSRIRSLLLASTIPFATLFAKPTHASASILDKLNPIPIETREQFARTVESIDKTIQWFKDIKIHASQWSIDLMVWSYDAITSVVLHTPLFLFDSDWFKDNIAMFTGLSLGLSMILAIHEGFKRMLGHFFKTKSQIDATHTDMGRISRRLPLVLLGSAIAPAGFFYGFQAINWLTSAIINIGKSQMASGLSGIEFNAISWTEMFVFLMFDIALIGMMIPIFLQNFRRWFDLMALGIMTPVALSCWMFKAHEHYFKSWWDHIKKCSMTQLVYGVFLLIIGSLMFGTKVPETSWEVVIKIGVIIGGLWRMANPPNIVRRYVDTGADITDMWNGASKSFDKKSVLGKGVTLVKNWKTGRLLKGGASA